MCAKIPSLPNWNRFCQQDTEKSILFRLHYVTQDSLKSLMGWPQTLPKFHNPLSTSDVHMYILTSPEKGDTASWNLRKKSTSMVKNFMEILSLLPMNLPMRVSPSPVQCIVVVVVILIHAIKN